MAQGTRQNGIGMLGAVLTNMGNRLIEIGNNFHVQIQRQILIVVLLRFHRLHLRRTVLQKGQGGRIGMQRHAALRHLFAQRRQEGIGDITVYQQRLGGIAGARALGLGVNDDLQRRCDLGGIVDENMAHADTAGDHRDGGLLAAQLMQACAAARDQHIDVFIHLQHFADQRAIRALDCLHRGSRQATLLQRLLNHFHRRGVGAPGLFTAAQNSRVAGLQAQRGDIDGHVRPRFINHADHSQRHATTFDTQAAIQQTAVNHLADRIRQATHLTHVIGDAAQARRRQRQAIEHRVAQTVGTGVAEVFGVGAQDLFGLRFQIISNLVQNLIFLAAG